MHYQCEEYIEIEKIRRKDLHRENPNSKSRAAVTVVSSSLARSRSPPVRTPTRASRVDPVEPAPRVRSDLRRAVAGIGALGSRRSVSALKATASAMADEEHLERREEASEVSRLFPPVSALIEL